MKASQLKDDIEAARSTEEGTAENLYPSRFFRHDVRVIAPTGQSTPCHPRYCASDEAMIELAAVLTEERGFNASPLFGGGPPNTNPIGGNWKYSDNVGWLKITLQPANFKLQPPAEEVAMKLNGGLVLDYFNHGIPAIHALNNAEAEIRWELFNQGFTKDAPDIAAILAQTK